MFALLSWSPSPGYGWHRTYTRLGVFQIEHSGDPTKPSGKAVQEQTRNYVCIAALLSAGPNRFFIDQRWGIERHQPAFAMREHEGSFEMRKATPRMREIAERLIAQETSQKSPKPAALLVCERLRPPLATLMGTIGFGALLARALSLATAESPGLRALHIDADGAFQGWTERKARPLPDKSFDGGITLLAHLLELLATFIGEDLTLRLLRELWPKLILDNPDFAEGSRK